MNGKSVKVVNPGYILEQDMEYLKEDSEEISSQGKIVVFVILDEDLAGAIPLAAGALYACSIVLSPAVGAVLISLSTVIVAVNARFLKMDK